MTKLHLGCGKRNFGPDWDHIDGGDYSHLKSHDIINLPYATNSVDLIYSSHTVEYFDREEIKYVLREWRTVLKMGGVLRIAVPDFEVISRLYQAGFDLSYFVGPLYGKMKMGDSWVYHKTVYDFSSLRNVLLEAGFRDIIKYDWRNTEHSQFDDFSQAYLPHLDKDRGILISLNVQGVKA